MVNNLVENIRQTAVEMKSPNSREDYKWWNVSYSNWNEVFGDGGK